MNCTSYLKIKHRTAVIGSIGRPLRLNLKGSFEPISRIIFNINHKTTLNPLLIFKALGGPYLGAEKIPDGSFQSCENLLVGLVD